MHGGPTNDPPLTHGRLITCRIGYSRLTHGPTVGRPWVPDRRTTVLACK